MADVKSITNPSCLIDNNSCFSSKQNEIRDGVKRVYKFDVRNPCIFPFKHENTTYNSCKRMAKSGFKCATSVDADLELQKSAFCNDLCPYEGMYFHRRFQSS